jgi:hypothetical protein
MISKLIQASERADDTHIRRLRPRLDRHAMLVRYFPGLLSPDNGLDFCIAFTHVENVSAKRFARYRQVF